MKNNLPESTAFKINPRVIIAIFLGLMFLTISLIFTRNGIGLLWLLPVALVLLLIAFQSLETFLMITVFMVPLSIQLRFLLPETPADIFLPTELMLPAILILVLFKAVVMREIDRRILTHPVTIISFCLLLWSFLTSVTGTMPGVSFKNLATRLWFFAGFYLLAAEIFCKREKIVNYFAVYIAGMIPVVLYFIYNMWQMGLFRQKASFMAVRPFFNDHTAIGASLAFCIPLVLFMMLKKDTKTILRFLLLPVLLLFSFAFVLSYSRAAWISLATAAIIAALMALKISWKIIMPGLVIVVIALVVSWSSLMIKLNENRQVSSGDLSKQLQSISNITTDVSNMERINRWKSALRMSAERPLFGWGPATYQFQYAPYQISSDKTPISTNYGEAGNAHSEYLSTLVDSGIPGLALYIALISVFLYRGIQLYRTIKDKQLSLLVLTLVSGLITYIVHGGLNNFLDTDKISALWWGMIAAIVALDIEFRAIKKEKDQ